MKKLIIFIMIFVAITSLNYGNKIFQQAPFSNCYYVSDSVEDWLNNAYKKASDAIINGRNGRKLPDCKISEIKQNLDKVILEYACQNCGDCAEGGPSHHQFTNVPYIRICDPNWLKSNIDSTKTTLDNPPPKGNSCGCLEGLIVHEIIHATTDGDEAEAVDCSRILFPCAKDPFDDGDETHFCNCSCKKKQK